MNVPAYRGGCVAGRGRRGFGFGAIIISYAATGSATCASSVVVKAIQADHPGDEITSRPGVFFGKLDPIEQMNRKGALVGRNRLTPRNAGIEDMADQFTRRSKQIETLIGSAA